jgi:glutamine cyclotransferase
VWTLAALTILGAGAAAWAFVRADAAPPVYGYEIVQTYPHDPQAFSQGLVYVDGTLYEGTGQYGESTLREVDLKTGQIRQRRDLDPRVFGEGVAVLGDEIFQLTWQDGICYVYDRATFQLKRHGRYRGEGWGLTTDGRSLILSDGGSRLRWLDPRTFRVTGTLAVRDRGRPVDKLNELETIGGEIWANVWHTDAIARISPKTGQVIGWIDLRGLLAPLPHREAVLNGIAWDAKDRRLFVTGKDWPNLFEIRLTGPR